VNEIHNLEKEHDTWLPTYGHAADGNIHTHTMKERWLNGEWQEINNYMEKYKIVRDELHRLGKGLGGLVSGEHGIGLVKKEYLSDFLSETEIRLMRELKNLFDPHQILNPGKIFKT
jgi:glycolate oxidase